MASERDGADSVQQILELSRELIELQRQVDAVHRRLEQQIREMQIRLASIEKNAHASP